jgi:porin
MIPPLVLGELQYFWNGKKGDPGLEGKFKVGGWRHFGEFADQRLTAQGISMAVPLNSGIPAQYPGNSEFTLCSNKSSIASGKT